MSVESMEEFLGIKFERVKGEALPEMTAVKKPNTDDFEIDWIGWKLPPRETIRDGRGRGEH